MDVEYGIGIKNKYDLQIDADPDFLHVKPKKAAKKQAASTGTTTSASTGTKKAPLQKVSNANNEKPKSASNTKSASAKPASGNANSNNFGSNTTTSTTTNSSGNKSGNAGASTGDFKRPQRDRPLNKRDNNSGGRDYKPRSFDNRGDGDRRDFGKDNRERRGPRGAPGAPPSRRDFDRKSGSDKTGVKPTEKRDGFGKANWGNFTDDAADAWGEEQPVTSPEDVPTNDENERPADLSTEDSADIVATNDESVEEEPQVFTLDEWRKQQEKERVVPQYNLRKAGEGDTQQWQKGYVLKKKNQEEEVEYEEIEIVSYLILFYFRRFIFAYIFKPDKVATSKVLPNLLCKCRAQQASYFVSMCLMYLKPIFSRSFPYHAAISNSW